MNKIISTISIGTLLGLTSLAGAAPASAAMYIGNSNYQQQDQYIGNFCDRHPDARQCNDWQTNHQRWSHSQYQSFYRYHHNDGDFGGNVAAGLFGFAAGAIVSSALQNGGSSSSHVRACASAYHSYSARSDTYLGYDGARHECML
jgi:chorismate synthase